MFAGRKIVFHAWHNLTLPTTHVLKDAPTFTIYVLLDPHYKQPLVLATTLTRLTPESAYHVYWDRWPVEQPSLATKQMIGLHRQFVFADESCHRLPG